MTKKVVNFKLSEGVQIFGKNAFLYPINHPDTGYVSNGQMATTSTVLHTEKDESGVIILVETKNTIYIGI